MKEVLRILKESFLSDKYLVSEVVKMPNDIANNMADTIHQLEKDLKDLREENKVLTT